MKLLVLAFLFCATPAWCDSLDVHGYFFGLSYLPPGCEVDSTDLSPVHCSAYFAPGNASISGAAQFVKIDDYHFQLKGTTSISKDPSSPVMPMMVYTLTAASTLPAFSGNYVLTNAGETDADFIFYNSVGFFIDTGSLPHGRSAILFHNNGEQDGLQLDNQLYAGESGNFDILISTTPTPEPSTAGMLILAFAAASAFAWRCTYTLAGCSSRVASGK